MWELVNDWYQETLGTDAVTDPTGPASGEAKIFRGGGWPSEAANCRSAVRLAIVPGMRVNSIRFRVAKTAP